MVVGGGLRRVQTLLLGIMNSAINSSENPRRPFVVAIKVDCKAIDVLALGVGFEGHHVVIQSIET